MDALRSFDFRGLFRGIFRRRKLNFMAIHYIYLISWSIAGSILLYPAGDIAYIDALFFACGASTQSGLNTLNVNQIHTYQQVVLYLIPMFTNPIVIHGAVVFVRLYWFEKRFQHVVQDAMNVRRTKARTMSLDREKHPSAKPYNVRGQSIVMLDDGHKMNGHDNLKDEGEHEDANHAHAETSSSSEEPRDTDSIHSQVLHVPDPPNRQIAFTDEVMKSPVPMSPMRLPEPRTTDQHIAFLERQRNPEDKSALRIPGPRDADRGKLPERIAEEDENPLAAQRTGSTDLTAPPRRFSESAARPKSEQRVKRNITIDDSARPTSARQPRLNPPHITFGGRTNTDNSNAIDDSEAPSRPRPRPKRTGTLASFVKSTSTYRDPGPVPYLSYQPTVGRNSAFVDLTEAQREELGGIEYRSLKTLAVIIIAYFFFWQLTGVICLVPWILRTDTWGSVVDSDGQNRVWWGIFSSATLFNDVGFTLTPDSFVSFNTAVLPLLLGTLLIIIGNTGFPCMLRLWIWLLQLLVPATTGLWEELRFLLDHPRRCFTLLFPSSATWVLFAILVLLNGIDLIFFIILDLNDPVVDSVPPGFRVLDGLFQAASTRTAGTAVVNISSLHPGIQVSYLIMMYISVFPIAISMRRTNVYEERSLGVYTTMDDDEDPNDLNRSYIGAHLRKQLSFDLWFIFVGLFIVAIAEGTRIADQNEPAFDLFACLFEIVSAYGTVGLSLGYPNTDESFSAEFTVVSKLVICAMMIRGRHRGLPNELDRAILLPSEKLHDREDQDAMRRNRRLSATGSFPAAPSVARSTAAERPSADGASLLFHRRDPHSHGPTNPRDAAAKVAEGLAHADSMAKEEVAKMDSASKLHSA